MTFLSKTTPTPADLNFGQPPDSEQPTAAQLKGDIDSGRTGDKVSHGDIGAAPLGTCDEAGGAPPTPQRVKLARANEAASERVRGAADVHGTRSWTLPLFSGAACAIGLTLVLGIWLGG